MFKRFSAEISAVSQDWGAFTYALPTDARDRHQSTLHTPYVEAASHALALVGERSADTRVVSLSQSQGVEHGTRVIMRYYAHALAAAAQQGIAYEQAVHYLDSKDSFSTLQDIAMTSNRVATAAEGFLCTSQDNYSTLEAPLDEVYQWSTKGSLSHPQLAPVILSKKLELGLLDDDQQCHAQKSHQLQNIAHALLTICKRDPLLAQTTYHHYTNKGRQQKLSGIIR